MGKRVAHFKLNQITPQRTSGSPNRSTPMIVTASTELPDPFSDARPRPPKKGSLARRQSPEICDNIGMFRDPEPRPSKSTHQTLPHQPAKMASKPRRKQTKRDAPGTDAQGTKRAQKNENNSGLGTTTLGKTQRRRSSKGKEPKASANRSLMRPAEWLKQLHPFGATLAEWERGVPVECGPNWSRQAILLAIERGPHISAKAPEAKEVIMEDIAYQVDAGFSEVIYWDDIKDCIPPHLEISPLAFIPQLNRRGRLILDLSFAVHRMMGKRLGPQVQKAVNETTTKLSPLEPLSELGHVLPRLLDFMADTPEEDVIMFAKIDLSDGFWRMIVTENDAWHFAYVLPDPPGHPVRLVIPHALQMGWTESPGYFCAATETGRDVMQALVINKVALPLHPLESFMTPTEKARPQSTGDHYQQMASVFVDDYCLAAVESRDGELLQRISRAALHTIHGIFPPPNASGHKGGKDPVSRTKLERGDARWEQEKEMLGFALDGQFRTVRLPAAKAQTISTEISRILKKNRIPIKRFQKIVGKLRHATLVLPSTLSLFAPLNKALQGDPTHVVVTSEIREVLRDFISLAEDAAKRPTHVNEILSRHDDFIGYCDASAFGAGGVWLGGECELEPLVWRVVFPPDITDKVVSYDNPNGTLTNSDLELAAILLHEMVLERAVNVRHRRAVIFSDNKPSVAWVRKMNPRSKRPIAHYLLRGLAMRQRETQETLPEVLSVKGTLNTLADVASRRVVVTSTPQRSFMNQPSTGADDSRDNLFLTLFNSRFPLLQHSSWKFVNPGPEMLSKVISTLRGKRLTMRQWTTLPGMRAGRGGLATRLCVASNPTWNTARERSGSRFSWLLPPGLELDFSETRSRLDPKLLRKPYVTWRKPSCWLDSTTPAKHMVPRNWIFPSGTC
jgi:hypothetical protein